MSPVRASDVPNQKRQHRPGTISSVQFATAASLEELRAVLDNGEKDPQHLFLRVYVERLSIVDFQAAREYVDRLSDRAARFAGRQALIAKLISSGGISEAVAFVNTLKPDNDRTKLLETAIQKVAIFEPWKAWSLLALIPTDPNRDRIVYSVVEEIVASNSGDPWSLTASPSDGYARNQAILALARRKALEDPLAALEMLNAGQLLPQNDFRLLQQAIFNASFGASPAKTLEAVLSYPSEPEQLMLIDSALEIWSTREPSKAAEFLASTTDLKADSKARNIMTKVAAQWARTEPEKAFQWLEAMPESSEADTAVATVFSNWAAYNPDAASQYAQKLPSGRRGDIAKFMAALAQSEKAETAEALAAGIGNPSLRSELRSKMAGYRNAVYTGPHLP